MKKYEIPQVLVDDSEEMSVDVHSSGVGLVVVGTIILTVIWPPLPVE